MARKIKLPQVGDTVEVLWLDSGAIHTCISDPTETLQLARQKTMGKVLDIEGDRIVVSPCQDTYKGYDAFLIAKVCIIDWQHIGPTKEGKRAKRKK